LQLLAEARFLMADYRGTLAGVDAARKRAGGHIDHEAALLDESLQTVRENWRNSRESESVTGFTDNAAASRTQQFASFVLNERAEESPSTILEADAERGLQRGPHSAHWQELRCRMHYQAELPMNAGSLCDG
jgi:hypothetical protein